MFKEQVQWLNVHLTFCVCLPGRAVGVMCLCVCGYIWAHTCGVSVIPLSARLFSYELSCLFQSSTDTFIFLGNIRLHYLVPHIYYYMPMWLSVAFMKHCLVLGVTHKLFFILHVQIGYYEGTFLVGVCAVYWRIPLFHWALHNIVYFQLSVTVYKCRMEVIDTFVEELTWGFFLWTSGKRMT